MKQNRSGRFSLTVDRHDCEDCGGTHAVVTTHERTKNNWQETSRSPIHPEPSEGLVRIVS